MVKQKNPKWALSALLVAGLLGGPLGCATTEAVTDWPAVEVGMQEAMEDVSGEPRFVRGGDGFLYIVGDFEASPQPGEVVFGRHGGAWPLSETPRPALFMGEVVKVLSPQVARVHRQYVFPETEIFDLAVDVVTERGEEHMGKGVGEVASINYRESTHLTLDLGSRTGVQRGDLYGVLRESGNPGRPGYGQLTRRLLAVCMVVEVEAEGSICRLWQGHPDHQWSGSLAPEQEVIFLEPSFGTSPVAGRVHVAPSGDEEVDRWLMSHLENYLSRFPAGEVEVVAFEEAVDAEDPHFYRWNRRFRTADPGVLLGATIVEREGRQHLVLNYTGLGSAVGPGMVAAPPESGVDMGRLDRLDADELRGVAALLMGNLMVYRGQTSMALMHLHDALRDEGLRGKWRWHARDQYAMRWGSLSHYDEAMWLVLEDEAVARRNDDHQAYLNALGTRARLHDYLDQPDEAYEAALEYLQAREEEKPAVGYLYALSMYAEMAAQAGHLETTEASVEEMNQLCPDGCDGDLITMLAGVYWAAYDESPELQDQLVRRIVEVSQAEEEISMASARMFEAWNFLRDRNLTQALIAFMEARRLYKDDELLYGAARAGFYITLVQVGRQEPQDAYDEAEKVLEYLQSVGDYGSVARLYERLQQIYIDLDFSTRPQPYLAAGPRVMQRAMQMALGRGDFGSASEASFSYGHFLMRIGQFDDAQQAFQQAVILGVRTARFDTVALSHLFLASIARQQGDRARYEAELQRARVMAEAADDAVVDELIESLTAPPGKSDDPTQLL